MPHATPYVARVVVGLLRCWARFHFLAFLQNQPFQVPVRNITLGHMCCKLCTSSQELDKFFIKFYRVTIHRGPNPILGRRKETLSLGISSCCGTHYHFTAFIGLLYFCFSCLTRVSRTARRQMIWTRDFRSFLLIVQSLCTQTWLGECFIGMSIHDPVTPCIGDWLMANVRSMNRVSNKNRFVWRNLRST